MKKKFLTLFMSLVLVFTLVACGNNTGNTTNETNKETTKETIQETVKETTKEIETKAENTNQNLGLNGKTFEVELEEALKIFYDTFGDNTIEITSFQLEEESNGYDYEIEGFKDGIEYEIEIDANTGNVKSSSKEKDTKDNYIPIVLSEIVSPEKAIEVGLQNATSKYVEEWKIKTEDGKLVYDIDFKEGKDVIVDAKTGEFIELD